MGIGMDSSESKNKNVDISPAIMRIAADFAQKWRMNSVNFWGSLRKLACHAVCKAIKKGVAVSHRDFPSRKNGLVMVGLEVYTFQMAF
jgi:hypothetical protein